MPNVTTCTDCHQPHSGELKIDRCGGCHDKVGRLADLANIRLSTKGDFDGNGKEEGIAKEIASLQASSTWRSRPTPRTSAASRSPSPRRPIPTGTPIRTAMAGSIRRRLKPDQQVHRLYAAPAAGDLQLHLLAARPGGAYHNGRYIVQTAARLAGKPRGQRQGGRRHEGQGAPVARPKARNGSMIRFHSGGSCSNNWRAAGRG